MADPMEIVNKSPRGTKRKADDGRFATAQFPKRIKVKYQDLFCSSKLYGSRSSLRPSIKMW